MTVSNPPSPQPAPAGYPPEAWVEDEIDLREYVLVLVKWWREIVAITLLTAFVAAAAVLGLRALTPPQYEAVATVAIARIQNDITFDERFRTLSQEELATLGSSDAAARRAALVGLVANGAIAQAVIEQLGDQLTEEERAPAALLEQVEAELQAPSSGRGDSDLIRIKVTADSPEKAAAIANAWAQAYVEQVNRLYGQLPAELVASVQTELANAQQEYDTAQKALEDFIADNQIDRLNRLIAEKKEIIDSLQKGRQTAITTIVDEELQARSQVISAYISAQAQNRLLAFNKEQEAKRQFLSALVDADTANRILALQKDQEIRAKVFAQYVNAEISNRVAALAKEQEAKTRLFNVLADADVQSKVAVYNQQVQDRIEQLTTYYNRRAKLRKLLDDARGLRAQVEQAGETGAATNSLALLLLKAEVFATSAGLPGNLQLTLDSVGDVNAGAAAQTADLDALIQMLENQLTQVNASIAAQSARLLNNEGLSFLDAQRPEDDELFAAIKQRYLDLFGVDELALVGDQVAEGTVLGDAVMAKYEDLFSMGQLATASTVVSDTTPLFTTISDQYPDLFTVGPLASLIDQVAEDNPLALLGIERAKELLQLQGLEDLPTYTAAAEPLLQAIDQLEAEIQSLQAQQEAESSRRQQLEHRRDLAWSTLKTLRNKSAEIQLADTAANSEVRFAAPAVEPLKPVERVGLIMATALAGIVGFMLAVFVAFFANFMGAEPILGKRPSSV